MTADGVRKWVKHGVVRAGQLPATRHYTDDKPRKTRRCQWRIYEADVMELLTHLRGGRSIRSFGRGFWKTK